MVCVIYLSLNAFDSGYRLTDDDFEARLQSNPLYDYAAREWGHHAHAVSTELGPSILDFLRNEAKVNGSSQAMMASEYHYTDYYSQKAPQKVTGIRFAAYFGLTDITIILLKHGYQQECKDSWGRTPLFWAAANGHEAVVKVLVEQEDVEADSKDRYGWTPFSQAAANGHEVVAKVLVEQEDVEVGYTTSFPYYLQSWM